MRGTRSRYGDAGGEDAGATVLGSGAGDGGGVVVVSDGGSDVVSAGVGSVGVVSAGVGSVGAVSVGAVSVGAVSVGVGSVGVVSVGLEDDAVEGEPVGEGALLSAGGAPVGDAVGFDVSGTAGGALWRIATISALKPSSWVEICASEYAVMFLPNLASRPQTSPSERSCSLPGVSSTDSTSWLAIAAVMHR